MKAEPLDLLTQAVERTRPLLADAASTKERIRILWVAAKQARDLAASDIVHVAFMALAVEANLIDSAGRWAGNDVHERVRSYGAEDVAHTINWSLKGWNLFETGPLK